ncbi:hypothetical protein M3Y97_00614400 [Aphelenchoides bicaudatus]|nr:hypothetical protein M3Y97_00614400 [Aphelenchoides bicaudatus]
MFGAIFSPFKKCLSTRAGERSLAYYKPTTIAAEHEQESPKKVVEVAAAEQVEKKVETLLPYNAATGIKIKMCEVEDGGMTYEIEVESDRHNSRFYELHNKDIESLASIFLSHPRAKSVELVATPLNSNGKLQTKNSWKTRNLKLNTTHFQRLIRLNKLRIQLNGLLELSMSAPFYFPIQELCLCDVDIKLYDFALLMRCVSHSLQHLYLEQIRIIDSRESNDFILQLQRIRSLQSLRIDMPLSEIYPSLSELIVNKWSALFVLSASLDFIFNASNFDLANTIFAQKILYKHNTFGPNDIQSLQQAIEDRRRRSKPVCKLRLVVGLPNNWSTRAEECRLESVFRIGGMEVFRLVSTDEFDEEATNQLDRTLFKLRL